MPSRASLADTPDGSATMSAPPTPARFPRAPPPAVAAATATPVDQLAEGALLFPEEPGAAEAAESAEGAEGAEGAEKPVVAEGEASAEVGEGDGDEDGDDDEGSESEDEVPSKGGPSKAETLLTQKEGGGLEVSVQQQLADMSCSLVYNAEDRRGESLPAKAPEEQGGEGQAAFAAKKLREKKAAFKAKAKAAKEKKKEDKKRTATAGGADGEDGQGKAGAPAAGSKKKKPRRGGGGGGAGSSGMGGRESQQHLARPGAVDWGAVVAEFGN
mmetsp:Transcript_96691/g.245857  ORF Transcript_96691/g.245857 Transcript_96691/m.245857 type:complete len:271 (+) Transcript_96691:384-1196(+)